VLAVAVVQAVQVLQAQEPQVVMAEQVLHQHFQVFQLVMQVVAVAPYSTKLLVVVWAHKVAAMVDHTLHKQVLQAQMALVAVAVVQCSTADQQATKAAMVL
jgi:hypothetical protein